MIGLYFLIGALVLLVALLLFGFVGCSFSPGAASCVPSAYQDYPTAVISTGDLVAYWRLGEPNTTPVPSSGGLARSVVADENGDVHHGDYFKLDPVSTPDDLTLSPATVGQIVLGVTPGLLELANQVNSPCINTDGGYVQVPWADELNPPQFTFEAWVLPDPFMDPKYFYCLAESTGPQGLGPKTTGWGLYLGPADLNNPDPAGPLFWQVWMGDGNQFNRVAIAKPDFPTDSQGNAIPQLRLTYLALTFDGVENLQLFLYYPDANQNFYDISLNQLQALNIPNPPIVFHRNDASLGGMGDFFIGTGSNLTSNPSTQRLYPFKGKIQEVALYKRDLSDQSCPLETLASHEMSGGNL
ncbi:MAG: hypothetical protein ACLP2P_16455 [Desulfobaccales bacterium]